MQKKEKIELYVSPELETIISQEILALNGVNFRKYKAKLLYILSRIHWNKIHQSKNYETNGAKLRIHSKNKELREGTLSKLFGGQTGKTAANGPHLPE